MSSKQYSAQHTTQREDDDDGELCDVARWSGRRAQLERRQDDMEQIKQSRKQIIYEKSYKNNHRRSQKQKRKRK